MEGALRPRWGVFGADLEELRAGIAPVLLRVLLTGKAGRAIFGGPFDGRDGLGSVVAMAPVGSQWACFPGASIERLCGRVLPSIYCGHEHGFRVFMDGRSAFVARWLMGNVCDSSGKRIRSGAMMSEGRGKIICESPENESRKTGSQKSLDFKDQSCTILCQLGNARIIQGPLLTA